MNITGAKCVLEGVPDSTKGLFVGLRGYESRLFQWAHCVQSASVCVVIYVFVMISRVQQ